MASTLRTDAEGDGVSPPDPRRRRRALRLAVPVLALVAVLLAVVWPATRSPAISRPQVPAASCDRYAAPDGSDRASGSARAPVRTVNALVRRLRPGQAGCLRAGRYREDVEISQRDIALRGAGGGRAVIQGRLWVTRRASSVDITDLGLDGRSRSRLPSPTVNGRAIRFARVDVTNHRTAICFVLGSEDYGRATGTVITQSRIHDCGRRPTTNLQHGIYVSLATGTQITDNVIYANADRGIQLYPDARATTITGNVLVGNGVNLIFSGAGGQASSQTVVTRNVIAFARTRADVESWYPSGNPRGRDNLLANNCIYGGRRGTIDAGDGGFAARDNVLADPRFVDAVRGDFRVSSTSRCAAILGSSTAPVRPADLAR